MVLDLEDLKSQRDHCRNTNVKGDAGEKSERKEEKVTRNWRKEILGMQWQWVRLNHALRLYGNYSELGYLATEISK